MAATRRIAAAAIEYIVRFDTHQRLQHFLMMSSFIVLALTGFPQKFAELSISQSFVSTLGGLETVRAIHRGAGFVMLSNCTYHVAYLFTRIMIQKRYSALSMVPQPKDALQALQMVRYFLGLRKEKPAFDRFSYVEKFDYWAVFWGIAMMGGSGLVLMFAVQVAHVAPGEIVPLAHTIHSDEAMLAVSWIAIVHMFNAHLAPGIFPFNPAIFTGKLRKDRYEHEHPLEYARLSAGEQPQAAEKVVAGRGDVPARESEGE
jgi:cytochrome b subunit of formate dehydrogenase